MLELSDFHNCEESEGKIVCISIDNVGVTKCIYCNQVVNYANYFKYKEAKRQLNKLMEKEIK